MGSMDTSDNGLPDGVADAVLNRAQLARALNKSEPTITSWIGEGLPFITEGTNGKAYEFQLSDCWRWMRERERALADADAAAEASVRQMRLALVGGTDAHGDGGLSPKERRELYEAEQSFMLTALQRGDLVKRGEIVSMLEDVMLTIRDIITSVPDRLEREAGLTGKPLDLSIKVCDEALIAAQRRIEAQATGTAFKDAAE